MTMSEIVLFGTAIERASKSKINVKVRRLNKETSQPYFQAYQVPFVEGMSVVNVLDYIYKYIDHSLTFPCSCRIGRCKCCYMKVNGRPVEACTRPCRGDMVVEPL